MTKLLKVVGWGVAALVALGAAGVAALVIAARTVGAPAGLGVTDGRLAPCPSSPNCVSTQADPADLVHAMTPIPMAQPAGEAQSRLRELLAAEPRVQVLRDEPGYIHAVFRTPTMGYPDDVEFYFDEGVGLIHFRSASRLGESDMGVNRQRMERLSAALSTALAR